MNTRSDRRWAAVLVAATLVTLAAAKVSSAQENFRTLISFDSTNGNLPNTGLVQGLDGNLYGTTYYGGNGLEDGTVFKITPKGMLTTLYSFCAQSNCIDGRVPEAGLLQAADGNFYGTTFLDGANDQGTLFKITPGGTLITLYNFCSQAGCSDGDEATAALVQGTDGNLYGTTLAGGEPANSGTVFKITPDGTLTTLYRFCSQQSCADGEFPDAPLVQGADGDFYGTTVAGGANNSCLYGSCGTVFKITPNGVLTTLHSFDGTDGYCGYGPFAGLIQGADGNFYGTTCEGGANGSGNVFKMTPGGAVTTLYSFCSQSNCSDGKYPSAGFIQATDGNFYGATSYGGTNVCDSYGDRCGTVFKITPAGSLTTLHSFDGVQGAFPDGLAQATSGAFYGTTTYGGTNENDCYHRCGTVFALNVGLGPFVETLPSARTVGAPVKILGTDLTGTTSVTFNGTAATFRVVSPSEIETKVPSGATTGPVQVVTPSGTLSSNVPFRVLP